MTANEDPVTIDELDVVRAPGFETGGFEIDSFSPGINLVHGPNAAGKTTTADSITRVLWPDAASDGEQLVGRLSLNGDEWRVDLVNGRTEYQRDGQEATAPNLPSADHRDRYRLSLHDLLQQDTRNESFAETIERESAGGYDLAAAHDELGFKDSPITRRKGVYQDAKNAVQTWREERDDADGLAEERSRLTKLESELEEARQARDEKEALEQAIRFREAKSEQEDAQAVLDEFPDVLEQVSGDELQRVEDLDDDIAEWKEEKQNAAERKRQAKNALEEAALPEDGVSNGVIARLKQRRDSLEECEARTEELGEELEGAKAERESAREDIPLEIDHEALADLEPGSWAEVSEFARRAERVQAERQRRDAIDQWTDTEAEPEADLRSLERGSKALEDWLMAAAEAESIDSGAAAFHVGAVAGAVLSLTGIALGTIVNPLLFSLILVGVALFLYGQRQQPETDQAASQQATHRESFEQTGLDAPSSWDEDGVRERLVELYDEVAKHRVVEEREQQREAVLAEQDLEETERTLKEQRERLREELGAAPETTDIELAVIVRRVIDWQEAHDEVVRLRGELERAEENLADARDRIQSELDDYGYEDVEDSAVATQRIRDLEQRQANHETATRDIDEAESTIEKARTKLGELRDQREEIYTRLGLEPGDRDALATLCEQVDDYESARSEVERAEAVLEQEREKLESLPEYTPELEEQEQSELRERLREAETTADRYDDLQEEISDIEAKIREAKTDTAVEEAITEKDRALDALAEQLDEDYSSLVGDVLVNHVQEETIEASRPAVFQRANELLATITHGRYELDVANGEQTFRAYDTAKQRGFALDELSSGTRVQVLLAVRLAFVEEQEQRAQLPILLDETLANADDSRADVIIESMIELARDGRQIFYFTAQGDEVAKWRAALEDASDVPWTEIDLADVRDLNRTVQVPEIDSIETLSPTPPEPAGHDHESYGDALDVEPFNPYQGAGAAHLWYVVEDVDVLHDLLELGIERWGQLQNLLERGRDGFVPADADAIDVIRQNAAALEEFTQAWQIGRGDPVDRSVLKESGAVSNTFIDRVTELAEDLNGDAEALVDALYAGEVDRFRHNKAEELEKYLRANGYIVSRDPLADDEIRIRMMERLVESGVSRDQAAERASDLLARVTTD